MFFFFVLNDKLNNSFGGSSMTKGVNKFKQIEDKLYQYYMDQRTIEQKINQKTFFEDSKSQLQNISEIYAKDNKKYLDITSKIDFLENQLLSLQKDILITNIVNKNVQMILNKLGEDEKDFIKLKYCDRVSLYKISEKFHYSAPTYYRMRSKILSKLEEEIFQ